MWRQPWQWMLMKATCWRRWFVQIVHPTWMIRWELWHFLKGIKISENTFMILYVYNLLLNIGIVKWNSFNISFVWSYYSSWMPSAGCAFGWLHDHRSQDSLGCTSWFGNHVTIGGFQLHHRRRPFCLGRHFLDPCNVTRWVTGLVPVKPLCFLVGGFLDSSIPGQYSVSGLPVHIEDRPRFTWLVNDVSGGRVTVTFSLFSYLFRQWQRLPCQKFGWFGFAVA